MVIIRILTIAAALLAVGAGAAHAQYDDEKSATVSASTVEPGDTITFSGTGCPPGAAVDFTSGATTADDEGNFSAPVTIPSNTRRGEYALDAVCGATVLAVTITVVAPGAAASLASTGDDSTIPPARLGLVLVAAGGLAVLSTRQRRARAQSLVNWPSGSQPVPCGSSRPGVASASVASALPASRFGDGRPG